MRKKNETGLQEKSDNNNGFRQICWDCGQKQDLCLCSHITKFNTNTHFVFLVHPKEFKKERIATGRMSHTALPNSVFLMGLNFTHDERVNRYLNDPQNRCFILWPGAHSVPVENISHDEILENKKIIIFVLDGTWAFAKKMYQLSLNLHPVDKISIEPKDMSLFIIKQQPEKLCLSTLEAIVYILRGLEQARIEEKQDWDKMYVPLKLMVERQIQMSQDPNRKSYRSKKSYDLDAIKERALVGTRKRKIF